MTGTMPLDQKVCELSRFGAYEQEVLKFSCILSAACRIMCNNDFNKNIQLSRLFSFLVEPMRVDHDEETR